MASASKRSKFFDNAKFILIFLVVFGHIISPLKNDNGILFTLYTVIFLFHMPAFILISGYFAKGFKKKGYLKKAIKKILIPYFIFQIIYSIYYYLIGQEDKLTVDFLHPHWSLWFLLSLFFWNLLLYVFAKLRWLGFGVAIMLGILVGYVEDAGSFLSISRTFVFFPYFLLGFLLNADQLKQLVRSKYSLPVGIFVFLATMLFFGIGFPKDAVPWLLGDTSYANMGGMQLSDGLIRALQYTLTLFVVFGFFALIPSTQYKITKIGERTLYVYLFHGFIIKAIDTMLPDESLEFLSGNYVLLFFLTLFICQILGSYFIKKYTRPLVELKVKTG
ncbi:acyltransferase family protein [Neobacillus cucumis]|uniref:acyltransferase family protein n=1 Tax=Neobacillus cucumis TaxID=1740721 RepID=UPI0019668C4B|nr:acyltransferase family protein [Neobacillus cucumis]MBM7655044.1 fucose 4-O-acetylase-like acetyltransferase [Neobacillus cucumis]